MTTLVMFVLLPYFTVQAFAVCDSLLAVWPSSPYQLVFFLSISCSFSGDVKVGLILNRKEPDVSLLVQYENVFVQHEIRIKIKRKEKNKPVLHGKDFQSH